MRVRPGSMLGKGHRAGISAALVVGWAGVIPLGINPDLRRVGGLCALNGTSVGGGGWLRRVRGPVPGSTVELV